VFESDLRRVLTEICKKREASQRLVFLTLVLYTKILFSLVIATLTLRLLRSKYRTATAINPKIPAVGPRLIKYNNAKTSSILTFTLSSNNNRPAGKNCENSIITVRTMK
jgi:hypothetical protein